MLMAVVVCSFIPGEKAELGPFREEVDFFVVKAICEVGDQVICVFRSGYYIGSTTRFLHDRTKEHSTNDNSSVKKHLTTHHRNNSHNIEVKVITRENDPVNLRLYEAYYIRKHKPGLNSREECTELNDLLF